MSDMPIVAGHKVDLKALLEAGVHFGHQTQRWNPKMKQYIYAARDGVHIFDLVKTAACLEKAMDFATQLGKEGKVLVMVGTKRQSQDIVKAAAVGSNVMYITTRWLGGLITNWEQVSKSINKMNALKKGLAEGKYDHYTKYERVQLQKDIDRLERFVGGVADLKRVPDALFVVDVNEEDVAVKEASDLKIPVIAIVDSNSDPDNVTYPIPGNDDAVSSLEMITQMVAAAYAEGKASQSKNA
jgi:small subunit ribosomal protein S2